MLHFTKKPVTITAIQTKIPLSVTTLKGSVAAKPGDWVITGVKGEMYPCDDEIFHSNYDTDGMLEITPRWCVDEVRGNVGLRYPWVTDVELFLTKEIPSPALGPEQWVCGRFNGPPHPDRKGILYYGDSPQEAVLNAFGKSNQIETLTQSEILAVLPPNAEDLLERCGILSESGIKETVREIDVDLPKVDLKPLRRFTRYDEGNWQGFRWTVSSTKKPYRNVLVRVSVSPQYMWRFPVATEFLVPRRRRCHYVQSLASAVLRTMLHEALKERSTSPLTFVDL